MAKPQSDSTCSKACHKGGSGEGRGGLGAVRAKEELLGSVGGSQGWFLFICPRRVSCCVFAAGAVQGSALRHIGHMQPQLGVIDPLGLVICSGKGYDLLFPRTPQSDQRLELPLGVLLVPAHPGVLGILQDAVQGFSLSTTYQGPCGLLLHQACGGI